MTKFKDLLVDTPNRYTVNGEVKTIVFSPNTITQEGTKDKAEYFNEMQKNGLYNVNATRVVEGTVEFYDIAIEGSDIFDVFDAQFIINFNETNTKLNPVLRFNGNNYYIRALEKFIDVDVQISSLQKTYIGFLDSANNKLKLMNYERKLTFDTVADLQTATWLIEGDTIQLLGYYENDGAGHYRKIESSDDGSGIAVGGLWANYSYTGISSPEHFGAVGDGIIDDAQSFIKSIKYDNFECLSDKYMINSTIPVTEGNKIIDLKDATINSTMATNDRLFDFSTTGNVKIKNVLFDGKNVSKYNSCMTIFNSKNVELENIRVINYKNLAPSFFVPIRVGTDEDTIIKIDNISFKDLYCNGNTTIGDNIGSLKAILVTKNDATIMENMGKGIISNVYFENIDNMKADGTLYVEDCDCIHIQGANSDGTYAKSYILIENVVVKNAGKRAVKFQCKGQKLNNMTLIDTRNDGVTRLSALSFFDEGHEISNVNGDYYGSAIDGELVNIKLDNVNINNTSSSDYYSYSNEIKNAKFSNSKIKGKILFREDSSESDLEINNCDLESSQYIIRNVSALNPKIKFLGSDIKITGGVIGTNNLDVEFINGSCELDTTQSNTPLVSKSINSKNTIFKIKNNVYQYIFSAISTLKLKDIKIESTQINLGITDASCDVEIDNIDFPSTATGGDIIYHNDSTKKINIKNLKFNKASANMRFAQGTIINLEDVSNTGFNIARFITSGTAYLCNTKGNISNAIVYPLYDQLFYPCTTANRPTSVRIGHCMFDTTLSKPIWYNGTAWKDAIGTTV
jgi:hypothetical protein